MAVAAALAGVWSLTAPLVEVPGMGLLTFMETGKLQGQFIKGFLIAGAVIAAIGWGRLAGVVGGLAAGLALAVACKQWESIQQLKEMNAEMISSGTSMGDMSKMLDVRIHHGAWVLGIGLVVFLLASLTAGWAKAKTSH